MGPRLQPMLLTSVFNAGFIILTMKIDFLKALSSYRLGLKKLDFTQTIVEGFDQFLLLY
jgi:hypothetical protein